MVVFYDLETKKIKRTEDNTMIPVLPFDMDIEEKKKYYKTLNEGFISFPYEIGLQIFSFEIKFDENGNFIGLQPIEKGV